MTHTKRLRLIGILVLVGGLGGAPLSYWLRTRNAEATAEELIPGIAEEEARQQQIMYGQTGAAFLDLLHDFARPDVDAVLIALAAVIGGVKCLRAAKQGDEDDRSTSKT